MENWKFQNILSEQKVLPFFQFVYIGRFRQFCHLIFKKCLTSDPGVLSLIPARSHTFEEIGNEIISRAILLPSADLGRFVVIYKRKYVHEALVNC